LKGLSDYDKLYFDMLYLKGCQGSTFEGKKAVDFLKLSQISPVSK